MAGPKYMIRCDMEGVSGVVSYDQVVPGRPEYDYGQRMFHSDLLSCADGLLKAGASEVVLYDEHCNGRNIDADWLTAGISFIAGKPPYRADWAGGLDDSFAGLVMLGFHSRWGTGQLLNHTYEHDICELRLNGVIVGEIGMETAIAGDFGVPLQLVTADSAGCAEAEALIPGVRTVSVKESYSATGAHCFATQDTVYWIEDAAQAIVKDPPPSEPWNLGPDVVLEVSFNPGAFADRLRAQNAEDINAKGDLTIHGATSTAVWADYWQRKLRAS